MRIPKSYGFHLISGASLILVVLVSVAKAANLTITDAWIRALPTSVPSSGYFTLHNGSTKKVILTGASSPACKMLMLHKSNNIGGMTSMEDVPEIDVPAGATVQFSPGAYHLMCMGVTNAIRPGNNIPVSLIFQDGSKLQTSFIVRDATGK